MLNLRIRILITALVVPLIVVNQLNFIDTASSEYTASGLKRTLLTYAVARGLNGVISVAQGTEVAIEPAGIGLTFTPGQILAPVNDLIERFSWVVLVSGTSLGVQQVLLSISAWWWFKLAVSVSLAAAILSIWLCGTRINRVGSFIIRLSLVLLVVRLCVPLISFANEVIYRNFLEPRYTASSEQLRQTSFTLNKLNQDAQNQVTQAEESDSLIDNAKRLYRSAADRVNIQARMDALKQAAENISEHSINLIVIFVTQTILLPLLFLWLFLQLIRWIVNIEIRTD